MTRELPPACRALLGCQEGVIARWQIPQAEIETVAVDRLIRRGRWQVLYRGVYATFTGPPSRPAVLWAAVLRAGPDAALSHHTAAELDLLADRLSAVVHVTVPVEDRLRVPGTESGSLLPRIVAHRSARIGQARHPTRVPPRTRLEETTLDLTQAAPTADEAIGWLIQACSRRLTTASLLIEACSVRPRLRWRREMTVALSDIAEGVHSVLEWRYVRKVERPHGLPSAVRQAPSRIGQRSRYLDNHYEDFGLAVELDGRAAHPLDARWRDIHRDNASAAAGITTLRYNWGDVTTRPCQVAAEVASVLLSRGWQGRPRHCGTACSASFP